MKITSPFRGKYVLVLLLSFTCLSSASGADRYVNRANLTPQPPYTNWVMAATNIQQAVNLALAGEAVIVSNGTYQSGIPVADENGGSNRVVIMGAIHVRSVNGPQFTSIVGRGPNGPAGIRCVYMSGGATLSGFTLTNGHSGESSFIAGGGVVLIGSTVTNCVIVNNSSDDDGGGIYCDGGTIRNSLLQGNSGGYGGGIYMKLGAVRDCIISGNTAESGGGGISFVDNGTAEKCLIADNGASYGGGVHFFYGSATVRNCVVRNNSGGGVLFQSNGLLENCTIVGNNGSSSGGGIDFSPGGTVRNCIVSFNSPANWEDNGGYVQDHCCTTPSMGAGCITNDPFFADSAAGNYRLTVASPCWNTGTNLPWMAGAADLDGYPRVIGPPDIGAYELSLYHYASTNGGNVWPYLTVNDGATNIQKAIDVSAPGDTVYVNDGIYRPAAELVIPTGRDITLRPWNLGGSVVLDGQNAHRVLLATNCAARIEGLTVRHGYVSGAGGGFLLSQGATVSACQFASNSAFSGGAICGPSGITISNCSFNVNTAYVGGAVHSFSSNPSEVTVLADCRLTGNGAANSGGGAYLTSGRVERCVFETNNAAGPGAGGIYLETGLVRNSLLVGNRANQSGACGGGVYGWCRIENCTIAGNQVPNGSGGGALASFVYNSIVYGNEAPSEPNLKVAFFQFGDHNNTEPAIGTFCITNAPRFVDAASGDYRLATNSLCLNAGANLDWMTASATDLEGYPRIVDGAADIGAYERTPVHYIHTRTKGRWPYLTPSDGFRDIQAVVESAHHGDTVYVAAGSYTQGTQIAVSKRITMTGSGGWAGTVIAGTASNRCFLVTTNAILDNLTLTRGYADVGGGAYLTGGAALRDCMVSSNRSGTYGGGAFIQTAGTLTRCSVVGNTAIAEGGGGVYLAQGGIVDSCQVFSNRARKAGGIFFGTGGRALNSLICQNQAVGPSEAHGGGLLFWQNGGRAEHCTVVSNSAAVGGGVYCNQGGALFNTLIYFNAADSGTNYHNQTGGGTFSACCTTPYIGTLCVTGNPCLTAGYRIDATSPCIDTATEILSRDIDGTPRPLDGDDSGLAVSDIGAYEHLNIYADSDWDGMPDGWENQHFGSPFGCTTPQADPDHDGQSNYRESIADTDPADSNSVFRALRIFWESEFWTVEASPSSALRVYSLQSSTNLTVSNSWTVVGSPHKRGNGGVIRFKNDSDSPVRFERVEVELP